MRFKGEIVLFRLSDGANRGQQRPAIVTQVWSDSCVNLAVVLDETDFPNSADRVKDYTSATMGDGVYQFQTRVFNDTELEQLAAQVNDLKARIAALETKPVSMGVSASSPDVTIETSTPPATTGG